MTREAIRMDRLENAEAARRRRRRADAEQLVRLASHLPCDESELLRVIYDGGFTAAEVARLTGRRPRTMQRRVKELVARVKSPLFEFVANRSDDWPPVRRDVGESVVLGGKSMREASRLLGVSLHRVRLELERIRTAAEERAATTDPGTRA